jgi:hypothetical protein
MSKENRNGESSIDSFKSVRSSATVVPSVGSDRSSKTVKGASSDTFYSTRENKSDTIVRVRKHGAKSDTVKTVAKANKYHSLKKGKSVGNIPTDKGIIVATGKKMMLLPKCDYLSSSSSIKSSDKYHSDHNPVAVYIPGLFDGNKSAYVITYNEKGNMPNGDSIHYTFISKLTNLTDADIIFIGIQEGDGNKTFIKSILNYIDAKPENASEKSNKPLFTSVDNITIANKVLNTPASKLSNWKLITNTYESTGKECLKKWKGVCLVNGCYVLLKNGCGLTIEDSGKDIIMKGGILKTTKHCAWVVFKQESTGIKHVFASCHLEYSGKYNPENGDLLGYDMRKEQLTGYISMLYKKYSGVSRFVFCGDTNMRMLTSAMYEYDGKKKYILDQMLYYLMQCDTDGELTLNSINAIKKYAELGNIDKYDYDTNGNSVLDKSSSFWECAGCDSAFGRKMLLYRLGGVNTFCSYLTGKGQRNELPKCIDQTKLLLGKAILAKFNEVDKYVAGNKAVDKFAGYCMNPNFVVGSSTKFRAYDFSYKALTSKCMMKTIWDVYNYKPTAIFTLDGPNRTFDYAKRVKSGNILAPAVVDRVFMFEPHKPYVSINNTKVGFVKY